MSSSTSLKRRHPHSNFEDRRLRERPFIDATSSAKFWFAEGDILIRVKKTLYLLQGILLEAKSAYFEAGALDRLYSGQVYLSMRVYQLPEDDITEQDWERLLTAVYRPSELKIWGNVVYSDELFSLLRIAKALEFDDVVDMCMTRLRKELPDTLDAFNAAYTVPTSGSLLKSTAYISSQEKLFRTINLALECDQKRALACAYFLALMEAIMPTVGMTHCVCVPANGSRVKLKYQAQRAMDSAYRNVWPILLELFSDVVQPSDVRHHYCLSKPISPACRSAGKALEAKQRACIASGKVGRVLVELLHSGESLENSLKDRCPACRNRAKAQLYKKRKEFWDSIPSLFGLESWKVLKNA